MQSTENTPKTRSEMDALIDELRAFSRAETIQGLTLTGDRYARAAAALAAERDRADRAEVEVTRMQMVRDALTSFEDGEIEHLVAFVREIDRIANNTKDDELSEAAA